MQLQFNQAHFDNKMLLATGILLPRFLCKLKYRNYSVITSVRSVEKAYHTYDFSLTSYLPEAKKLANLKYKKEHNSGKNYRKIVIIELDLDTLRYTYIPHLASFTGYHTETTKIANLKYNQRLSGLSLCRSTVILFWGNFIQNLHTKFQLISPNPFREDFFNWPMTDMNCLWWPCLLTNLDEMNNLYSNLPYRVVGPYGRLSLQRTFQNASYQVSVHFAKQFQRRFFFRNLPTRNKHGP